MRTRFQPLRSGSGRLSGGLLAQARRNRQRGVSLFITLVMMLLALIIVLGALAVSNLNESLVGNQSDAQRAYGAAEALLDAAQRDIRLNGRYCTGALGQNGTNNTIVPGAATPLTCTTRYPTDGDASRVDYMQILSSTSMVGAIDTCATNATFRGVCISDSPTNTAFLTSAINNGGAQNGLTNGATYTQSGDPDYASGVNVGSISTALANGGYYWVEIFPYNVMSMALTGAGGVAVPDGTYPYVFRITAIANGLRGTTVSVLRTYYVPYPMNGSGVANVGNGP